MHEHHDRRTAYVGMANAVPDSRTPRRFTAASSDDRDRRAISTLVTGAATGTAETMLSTPAETDTATVST